MERTYAASGCGSKNDCIYTGGRASNKYCLQLAQYWNLPRIKGFEVFVWSFNLNIRPALPTEFLVDPHDSLVRDEEPVTMAMATNIV